MEKKLSTEFLERAGAQAFGNTLLEFGKFLKTPEEFRIQQAGQIAEQLDNFLRVSTNADKETREDAVAPIIIGLLNVFVEGFEGSIKYDAEPPEETEECDCDECRALKRIGIH